MKCLRVSWLTLHACRDAQKENVSLPLKTVNGEAKFKWNDTCFVCLNTTCGAKWKKIFIRPVIQTRKAPVATLRARTL